MLRFDGYGEWRRPGWSVLSWPLLAALLIGLFLAFAPLLTAAPLAPSLALLAPFVALLIFVEPLAGIALMLCVGPWGALENVVLGDRLLDSGQILFFATTGAWVANGLVRRRLYLPPLFFTIPLALFGFIGAFSLLDAPSPRAGLIELFKWLEIGVVALIVVDRARTAEERWVGNEPRLLTKEGAWRLILLIILASGVTQALVGIWQFGLRGTGPEHFQILGGRFYRAYGTFEQPNPFGGFMAWLAVLATGALIGELMQRLEARRFRLRELGWPLILGAAAVLALLALVFSWSRGAWLGFAAGLGALLLLWPRRPMVGMAAVATGVLGLFVIWQSGLLAPAVVERVAGFTQDLRFGDVRGVDINDANYAVLERLAHWQAALDMAKYNLWSGVGLGNYEAAYHEYALINWPFALGHAHNYYLNILAETGAPGLLSYLLLWALILWQTLRVIRVSAWPDRGLALGLFAVWIALSVHHLLDKLYVNNLYLYLGALVGALQVLYERWCRKV